MSADNNPLEIAEDLAGESFQATIEDNAFVIRPAEAGIALMAALSTSEERLQAALDSADQLATALEAAREENGLFRSELEIVADILDSASHAEYVKRLNDLLWAVVGVTEDGTEVPFTYNEQDAE
jgi:GAF domain-containing protein